MKIILYTTDCPKCKILEKKLKDKNIKFETITDRKEMIKLCILSSPNLDVDGCLMDFSTANNWINDYKGDM